MRYKITRFYRDGHAPEVIRTGLSLEAAQAHCQDPETSSSTATGANAAAVTERHGPWFDGYGREE